MRYALAYDFACVPMLCSHAHSLHLSSAGGAYASWKFSNQAKLLPTAPTAARQCNWDRFSPTLCLMGWGGNGKGGKAQNDGPATAVACRVNRPWPWHRCPLPPLPPQRVVRVTGGLAITSSAEPALPPQHIVPVNCGLPMVGCGVPMVGAGVPMVGGGLPMGRAGLSVGRAGLPRQAQVWNQSVMAIEAHEGNLGPRCNTWVYQHECMYTLHT